MDLSVIENDPTEVKKYLQNFVPINYYRVLGDEYLYQVRASLLHSVSLAGLYNPKYDKLINDLVVETAGNYGRINSTLEVMSDFLSAQAIRTDIVEVEAANANASILKIQQASAEQNRAQASVNERLEASLDDIVVGGRNIMKNSDFSKGYRAWQEASITKHNHFIGTMHKISSTGITGSLMGIYPLAEYQNMAMVEGSQYSISFYAYGSILLMDEIYLTSPSEAPIKLPSVVISTDLTDRRHITFKAPTGGGGLGLIFGATATSEDDWFSISRIKVELGNKPSDWTPAPEDVEGYIAQVQATIDSFKDVQVTRNNAVATTIDTLNSRLDTTNASITLERETNVTKYASLAELTTRLESETLGNRGLINEVNSTLTDRFNSSATRIESLEAENTVGKGKIETLENVATNLGGVIASQSTTLNARIDGMSGGRNLLMNADFKLGVDTWGTATITNAKNILGNLLTVTNTGTASNYFGLMPVDIFNTIPLIEGKQYVLSFHARGNIPVLNDIWIKATGELPQKLNDVTLTDTLNDKIEIVFTSSFTTEVGSLLIGATGYPKNSWFSVVAVQIEEGNKATSWALSPDDGGAAVAEISANIEEFQRVQALENKATADKFTTLDVQYGENNARIDDSISVVATTAGNIKAEAKVLTEVNGKVSGWKNLNDGTTSSFDILADNFSVGSATTMVKPFSISGNDIVFNGKVSFNSVTGTGAIDKAINDINNLEIGGRNYLKQSEKYDRSHESFKGSTASLWGNRPDYIVLGNTEENKVVINIPDTIKPLETFTVSFESLREYESFSARLDYAQQSGTVYTVNDANYHKHSVTFVKTVNDSKAVLSSTLGSAAVAFKHFKVEKGNKTTDWTPAPEDVEGRIKGVENNIYYPNTTTIDGGKIRTNSIHANRIEANTITAGMINTTSLSAISSNLGTITGGSIKIGSNFNVTTAGALTASSGNFTGVVNATSGSFKGAITASTININNNFKVDSTGKMTATSGTFSGSITGATGAFSGTVSAANVTGVTSLSVLSANMGNITAGSIKIGSITGSADTSGNTADLARGTMFKVDSGGGFRLISRDATGGIELSSYSRALTVWSGNTIRVKAGKL